MERYEIGESGPLRVEVRRLGPTSTICLLAGSTTLAFAGEYGLDLATRLRQADLTLALRPARAPLLVYANELVEISAGSTAVEAIASDADAAPRVSLRLPQRELAPLAGLFEHAHRAVTMLRAGAPAQDAQPDEFVSR